MRWALILVTALLIALIVGVLTYLQAGWPAALLAALAAGGATIPAMHQLLGP
jgi:hypothetical protein